MPPQLQALLQDRQRLMIVGGGLAVLLIIVVLIVAFSMGGKKEGESRPLKKDELVLATVNSIGQAIEIQALMARQGINLLREDIEGGKAKLIFEKETTLSQKDQALVELVQSGLMDKNVGLEVFDKSDLTASREEKRIRLIRARNGELARLIRKVPPIEDATVFISMPEDSLFKRNKEPLSASVQVSVPVGTRLGREQVRSILNLLVGSIENLDARNVSLSDTNGNVYNSVLPASIDLIDRLEERDHYMEEKVKSQLNNLLGQGNYVVTVSTHLRETPKAEMELSYSPNQSAVMKSSRFNENMNNNQRGQGLAAGPTSSYVPEELDASAGAAEQQSNRAYNRGGQEVEYNTGKRQVSEDFTPGMIENISVAVTIKDNVLPEEYDIEEFKALVARTASPLVQPENVSVLFQDKHKPTKTTLTKPKGDGLYSWMGLPWWVWAMFALIFVAVIILLLKVLTRPVSVQALNTAQEQEVQYLRELAQNQAQQLEMTQRQTQQLIEQQQQQFQQISAQQQNAMAIAGLEELKQSLAELQTAPAQKPTSTALPFDGPDDELQSEIKSWIETS